MKSQSLSVLVVCSILFLLTSCASLLGAGDKSLIRTVSIEHNCPKEEIKIVEKNRRGGGAYYALDACGKRLTYKRIGSAFIESTKADSMIKSLTD